MPKFTVKAMPNADLHPDPLNPRLREYCFTTETPDRDIIRALWEDMAVDEIALSIAENGYLPYEPLFAASESGRLVVVEGNRRLAAIKLLTDSGLRQFVKATDLPTISPEVASSLKNIPTHICRREEIWQYLGIRHVNGPQPWSSFSKAQFVTKVHNETGVPLGRIASQIGDRHATVKRLYRAFMVLEQARKAKIYFIENRESKRFAFSHLFTALDYSNFQSFLGIKDEDFGDEPIPNKNLAATGEVLGWMYGDRTARKQALIRSQNPHLRQMDEALGSVAGVNALRGGATLDAAVEASRGDHRVLSDSLISAKSNLQMAAGRVATGFAGEEELFRLGRECKTVADHIVASMAKQLGG